MQPYVFEYILQFIKIVTIVHLPEGMHHDAALPCFL
jgi:hypothetical protein